LTCRTLIGATKRTQCSYEHGRPALITITACNEHPRHDRNEIKADDIVGTRTVVPLTPIGLVLPDPVTQRLRMHVQLVRQPPDHRPPVRLPA
jgi:hypothetical protein